MRAEEIIAQLLVFDQLNAEVRKDMIEQLWER